MTSELTLLVQAGVPIRAVRISVRERVVARLERGPLDAREVGDAVQATLRAACRLVRERQASDELVDTVWRAVLDAVRGHGGQSATWLEEAVLVAATVLDEWASDPGWRSAGPRWGSVARVPIDW